MKIYSSSNANNFLEFWLDYNHSYNYFSSETDTEVILVLLNNNTSDLPSIIMLNFYEQL